MTTAGHNATASEREESIARRRSAISRYLGHRSLVIGGVGLALLILIAVFAPLLTWHDPYMQDLTSRRIPPIWHGWFYDNPKAGWLHPLGTDPLGRDYFTRLVYGARISLFVGFSVVALSCVIGTTLGVLAGYFGGRIDAVISFIVTTRLSMPVVLVALAVVSIFDGSLQVVILVLGLLLWDRFAVVMRSVTLQIKSQEFVTAARAVGCSNLRIILTEIMPNVANSLIIVATIEMAVAIIYEASLSFLGLGIQPPLPSWGLMLAEARPEIFFAAWMITLPGIALFLLVLFVNLLGDGVRDITAPEGRA
ncbi:ABC transporter permease [Roseovarius sp.]|jgi:peptide/nickel transport system permease protein|uniref:ABC transporter permease n=1 Tax=Roseovarius sp. TaxID=1486281 RepID=UPI00263358F4|nr:ABC transporter permease [Roseovarius sp.]MDM8165799.1 ABC transporter permease [Roseovarius sp.]